MQAGGPGQGSSSAAQMAAMKQQLKSQLEARKANEASGSRDLKINIQDPGAPGGGDDEGLGQAAAGGLVGADDGDDPPRPKDKGKGRKMTPPDSSPRHDEQDSPSDEEEEPSPPRTPPRGPHKKDRAEQLDKFIELFSNMTPRTREAASAHAADMAGGLEQEEEEQWEDEVVSDQEVEYANPYRQQAKPTSKSFKAELERAGPSKRQRSPQEMKMTKRSRLDSVGMHHSFSEPILKGLPFVPNSTSATTIDMPSLVIINKMRNSMYVPLWHFTQEGIIAGRARDAHVHYSTTASLSKMLDAMGANAQLGDPKKEDKHMSYLEMSSAMTTYFKVYDKIIVESDSEAAEWLTYERDAWKQTWHIVSNHQFIHRGKIGWKWLSAYVDKFRHEYFDSP
ncbi:hypothetical protein CF319_g5157, partial [Tilletia indica]